MAAIAVQPFAGTYRAVPVPSTFAFAVDHSGVFHYRGTLSDVAATLSADGDGLVLDGSARVESISVVEPPAMRESVLGPAFFDAERHPEITFRSTAVRLADDGRAEGDGEVTVRGVNGPGGAAGRYGPPAPERGRHPPGGPRRPLRRTATEQLRRDRGPAAARDLRPPRVRIRLADGDAGRRQRGRLGRGRGHRTAAQARRPGRGSAMKRRSLPV